jgi:hypothetical protein
VVREYQLVVAATRSSIQIQILRNLNKQEEGGQRGRGRRGSGVEKYRHHKD